MCNIYNKVINILKIFHCIGDQMDVFSENLNKVENNLIYAKTTQVVIIRVNAFPNCFDL